MRCPDLRCPGACRTAHIAKVKAALEQEFFLLSLSKPRPAHAGIASTVLPSLAKISTGGLSAGTVPRLVAACMRLHAPRGASTGCRKGCAQPGLRTPAAQALTAALLRPLPSCVPPPQAWGA